MKLHRTPTWLKNGKVMRNRVYGTAPRTIRQSDQYGGEMAIQTAEKFTLDQNHRCNRGKQGGQDMRLVIIRQLATDSQSNQVLYKEPAYLICTSVKLPVEKLLQAYLWRWGIEVNFRDQKTLLGCGQAQVRKEIPCGKFHNLSHAVYSMLLLASSQAR